MAMKIKAMPIDSPCKVDTKNSKEQAPNFHDKFTIIRTLETALYGSVELARHNVKGHLRAVKMVTRALADAQVTTDGTTVNDNVLQEIRIGRLLREMPSQNLLALSPEDEQFIDDDTVYLVMPYIQRGSLFGQVKGCGPLSQNELSNLFKDLVSGLSHLHEDVGMTHMDLSLENILVRENGDFVICDFGLARLINGSFPLDRVGKRGYMACEIWDHKQRRTLASHPSPDGDEANSESAKGDLAACDVFSLGVVLFTAAFGLPPHFYPCKSDPCFAYIQEHGVEHLVARWGLEHECSACMQSMIQSMLDENPAERPRLAELKAFALTLI